MMGCRKWRKAKVFSYVTLENYPRVAICGHQINRIKYVFGKSLFSGKYTMHPYMWSLWLKDKPRRTARSYSDHKLGIESNGSVCL